jgi:hypothetical protein
MLPSTPGLEISDRVLHEKNNKHNCSKNSLLSVSFPVTRERVIVFFGLSDPEGALHLAGLRNIAGFSSRSFRL